MTVRNRFLALVLSENRQAIVHNTRKKENPRDGVRIKRHAVSRVFLRTVIFSSIRPRTAEAAASR